MAILLSVNAIIISMVLAVVIALSLRFFVFEFIRVEGQSMEPTLFDNEYVFMQQVSYYFDGPQHGDIPVEHQHTIGQMFGLVQVVGREHNGSAK